MTRSKGDLSVTALYTSETWAWGHLPNAELIASVDGRRVFRFTNAVLWLARLFRRELPSLRHSLLQRHTAIDRILSSERPEQVIELASGLSRRGITFSANPALEYIELDLPPVVARKRALLERTAAGRAALARPNFRMIERDVQRESLNDLTVSGRLCLIAEGLFMYLSPTSQRALWSAVRGLLNRQPTPTTGAFLFDLVPTTEQPRAGLIGRALEWLMKRFTGGRAFEKDQRTREDIAQELREAGFSRVELLDPHLVAREWGLPFPDAHTQQLLFICRP